MGVMKILDANESHVASAVWKYKVATKIREEGMAEISIEESPEVIPIPFSMSKRITERTVLEDFSVDDVSLEVALRQLTVESAKWGEIIGYEGVIFLAVDDLSEKKVTYTSERDSMRFICEELALQVGADLEFKDTEVLFVENSE